MFLERRTSTTSRDVNRAIRVLLIEEDVGSADLVRQSLAPAGSLQLHSTRFLKNGLQLLDETDFDAVLLELNLPDSRGIDTFRRIAAAANNPAIVILSSLDDPAYIQEALRGGAQDYLIKNQFDYARLAQRIQFAVERQRSTQHRQQSALHSLQTREGYYRTLLENASATICVLGRSGVFKDVNPAIENVLGYTPEELRGRLLPDLLHRDELAQFVSFNGRVEEAPGELLKTTVRIRHRNGTWRTIQLFWRNLLHDPKIRGSVVTIYDNTRYRKAIQERWDSESRYQSLFDRSRDAVFLHDLQGNILDANPAALEMFGYSDSALGELTFMDLLPEEEQPRVRELIAEIRENGQQMELAELRLQKLDGTFIYVEVMGAIVLRDGRPWAIQGVARDVTSRIRALQQQHEQQILAEGLRDTAEKLLSSTLNLQEMLDHILEQVAMLIPCDGATLMLLDSGVARVAGAFGYNEEERRQIEQIEMRIAEARNLNELDAHSGPLVINDTREFEGWRNDLLPFLARIRSYLGAPVHIGERLLGFINLDSGNVGHFTQQQARHLALFCDMAAIALNNARLYERLEARVGQRTREVRQERDRMQAILDQMGDAVVILNADGRIRHFNPALLHLAGDVEPDALHGKEIAGFLNEQQARILGEGLRDVVETRRKRRFQLCWSNGVEATYNVTLALLEGDAEAETQVICNLHDITDIKQAEAQLSKALEKEREINEMKSHFTALVSHEFRTPLSAIGISADLLRRFWDRLPEEKRQRQLHSIETQVKRLGDLVEEVSRSNHSEMAGLRFRPVPTDLSALCRQIVDEENLIEKRDIFVQLNAENVATPISIDPDLFHHISRNLVSNAVKYSEPSSTVSVDVRRKESQLLLTVSDQGIGIPASFQNQLFESFRRADNVGDRPGSGLGLTIVKRAVDAHGGTVNFTSAEGEGTTFVVKLPLDIAGQPAKDPASQTQQLIFNGHHTL